MLSSVTVRSRTLLCMVNCASLSNSFVNRSRGGEGLLPNKMAPNKMGVMEEAVATVLAKTINKKHYSLFYAGGE